MKHRQTSFNWDVARVACKTCHLLCVHLPHQKHHHSVLFKGVVSFLVCSCFIFLVAHEVVFHVLHPVLSAVRRPSDVRCLFFLPLLLFFFCPFWGSPPLACYSSSSRSSLFFVHISSRESDPFWWQQGLLELLAEWCRGNTCLFGYAARCTGHVRGRCTVQCKFLASPAKKKKEKRKIYQYGLCGQRKLSRIHVQFVFVLNQKINDNEFNHLQNRPFSDDLLDDLSKPS